MPRPLLLAPILLLLYSLSLSAQTTVPPQASALHPSSVPTQASALHPSSVPPQSTALHPSSVPTQASALHPSSVPTQSPALHPSSVPHPEDFVRFLDIQKMAECITTLADSALNGRETGSVGASGALVYICDRMRAANLRPMGSGIPNRRDNTYAQPFSCPTGQRGRNAIGLLPASDPTCQQYIIVSAHYDHLGRIKGILYPGADSNASGVGVMLSLADAFAALRQAGVTLKRNLLFVAYDGKEFSMAGARFFAATLGIAPENIVLNLNIDQIGCTFEPPTPGNPNYILVLGDKNTTPEKGSAARFRTLLDNNNLFYATKLDIDYTFYNSPTFGDIFFQMTEQCFLAQQGVPSLLITSGVHDATYKPQDTPDIINYPVLAKRTRWLFFSLWDLLQR